MFSYKKYPLTRTVVATVATKVTVGIIGQIREDLNLIGNIGVDIYFAGILLIAVAVRASRSSGRSRPATVVIFPTMTACLAVFLFHPPSIQIYIIRITNKSEILEFYLIGSIGIEGFAGILFAAVVVRASGSSGRSRPATVAMMACLAVFLLHPPSIQIYSIIRITTNKLEFPSVKLTTTTANRTTNRAKRAKNFILFLISCLQR